VYNLLGQGNTLDFVTISVVLYKNGGCKINGKGRNILNLNQLSTTQIQLDLHQKTVTKDTQLFFETGVYEVYISGKLPYFA